MIRTTASRVLRRHARWAGLALGLAIGPSAWPAPVRDEPPFGLHLLAEYTVPADTVARYARFKPSAPMPGEPKLINALMADTVEWVGPPTAVGPGQNPYRLVLRVRGQALADGDVASLWLAGWRLPSPDGGTQERIDPVTGVTRAGVRAGEPLTFVAASGGSTFKTDRTALPFVGLVNLRNLRIDEVRVEVWQGVAAPHWRETLLSLPALGVGLVMLLLVWWWRR